MGLGFWAKGFFQGAVAISTMRLKGVAMEKILQQFNEARQYVDSRLQDYLRNDEPLLAKLYESVNYSLQSGGYRFLTVGFLWVGELFDVQRI